MSPAPTEIIASSPVQSLLSVEHSPTPMPPSRYAGRFWFYLLDYKHLQLQMLLAKHTNLPVCRLGKHMAIEENCSVIAAPGNIHPNKLCSNPCQCLELSRTLQGGSEPAWGGCSWCCRSAMPGRSAQETPCFAVQEQGLTWTEEVGGSGGEGGSKIIPKLTLVLCCSAWVKVLLKISIQQNHLINLTG